MERGIEKIHERELNLWRKLRDGVSKIDNIITYCAQNNNDRNPVLSFNIKDFDSGDVGTILDVDYGIACRTGLQCAPKVHEGIGTDKIHGTVRLSIGPFNDEDHIDKAIVAIQEISVIRR